MALNFVNRHVAPNEADIKTMLAKLGLASLDELVEQTIPRDILLKEKLKLSEPLSENEYLLRLKKMAQKNKPFRSLIGGGYFGCGILPVVVRNIFENPCWYTSYTPYQAEISQGRLEALLIFQTMISSLTGFPLSNCSMLDDAQAAAEAMRMMYELRGKEAVKAGKNSFFVDSNVYPQVLSVLKTRASGLGIDIEVGDYNNYICSDRCYGALVQYPAANGEVRDYTAFCEKIHAAGGLVAAYCDLLALAILKEPASWGADVAVGSAQRFGLPMGFGGPTAGFMATKEEYKRHIPGRIIGISVDRLGGKAYRLALQTREQHIKREKATSNVCTATALMATMSGMYAVYHGPQGIKDIAGKVAHYARTVSAFLEENGYELSSGHVFDTIEINGRNGKPLDIDAIRSKALELGYNFGYCGNSIRISFDELTDCKEALAVLSIFGTAPSQCGCKNLAEDLFMARETPVLQEDVFNLYHNETDMMRFIKRLERKDISLAHSMIPLGSCTMKLNAAVEMMPLSWSEFENVHPFAPKDQVEGYMELIADLEHDLSVITGFDACSLQPNSGAGGEYAGLMTIKRYFKAAGEEGVSAVKSAANPGKKKSVLGDTFVGIVSGIFMPFMGAFTAAGLIKGFLVLFTTLGVLDKEALHCRRSDQGLPGPVHHPGCAGQRGHHLHHSVCSRRRCVLLPARLPGLHRRQDLRRQALCFDGHCLCPGLPQHRGPERRRRGHLPGAAGADDQLHQLGAAHYRHLLCPGSAGKSLV